MEVSVRPPKNTIMMSFLIIVFQISIFVEHQIGYQPSKFQCSRMSGSNFMDRRCGPPVLHKINKPSVYRVNIVRG